ncbi:hypothetical protein PMSD_20730 [Paenibacillus macquariensis subsp. defensor]|nr:hypothetical protein PMSD_20730 [Paenibacillus macquariensis subsp. defensor]
MPPFCGTEARFISSKEFYGKDYKTNIYSCKACDAYVGTRGNGKTPLGTMVNAELREYRKRAHSAFDQLWKGEKMSRAGAYKWMAVQMGLDARDAHIAMFDVDKCKRLIGYTLY